MLKGYKTYTGLVLVLLGYLGMAHLITEAEVGKLIDSLVQIFGIALAFYGRYAASRNK